MTDRLDSDREGTDETLMVRYQRGDRNALAVIVRRYARSVYATAHGITGDAGVATELAQNAFLALVGQAGHFHIEMRFRAWLFGFLHQLLLEESRTRIAARVANGELEVVGLDESGPEEKDAPPARPARSQLLSRRIAECLENLPLQERETIVMKLTAQLSLTELSAATFSDGDAVRARLRFAFDRLRESVSDTEEYARALR